jgi:3-oxoacyl-[acyl-carrier-protein] synthase II
VRRIAVTGIGVVSPLGHGNTELFENALQGRSAVRVLSTLWADGPVESLAASVDFNAAEHFEPVNLRMLDRVTQFALLAARRALGASGLVLTEGERERTGVFVGTGMGAATALDDGYKRLYEEKSTRVNPLTILLGMHNAPAAWIAIENRITGPTLTYSTACSSSAVAIGEAWLKLAHGEIDIAIAGGAEAPLSLGSRIAWSAMRALASVDSAAPSASCKPFAKDRSGMVLGEGAAMIVLEPFEHAVHRGASIYGEILGYGMATDVVHIARPSVDAQAAALRAALRCAQLDPSQIDAINAHGTGTRANDCVETAAIRSVFGALADRIPISATKAIHGHLLGAAGALECVLSLLAMRQRVLLPTMHLKISDPECDLDYVPNTARRDVPVRTMLSNSFAFGGTNVVLALRHAN